MKQFSISKMLKASNGTYYLGLILFATLFASMILAPNNRTFHFTILHLNDLKLTFSLTIDKLSRLMGIFILLISTLIFSYAQTYLKSDNRSQKFLLQFITVVLSALMLSLSHNLVTAFIAWQFIGITLYLLLNYYHHDPAANKSAKKKFVINRLGDCSFLIAIIIALHTQESTAFSSLPYSQHSTLIAVLLFISVLTKCAQFPFHIWLLDTMEAPTPVSALMHAGIINSGGILLTRVSHLITQNQPLLIIMMITSLVTILLTSYWKKKQPDTKKQLAYSTSGQMGYMIMQCSVGAFPAAILHLITHGFFKASLFLNSGDTLNAKKPNKEKQSIAQYCYAFIISAVIGLICFLIAMKINLKLPAIIVAFIFFTIFTAVKLTISETRNKKYAFSILSIITALVIGYLFILDAINQYLGDYQFSYQIIPSYIQVIAAAFLLLAAFFMHQNKINHLTHIDNTESVLRIYLLNNIRRIGEWISLRLDKKYNMITLSLISIGLLTSGLLISSHMINLSKTAINITVLITLTLNIGILLAANRAHTIKSLVILLFCYQAVFISYALMHQSHALNEIIIYHCINLLPVLLLLYSISRHQTHYPKHYLTTSLLLLIGIPGSASFISEIALLNAMYQLGYFYLFLYLSGIMLLSLTIMHALQLYIFVEKEYIYQPKNTAIHNITFIFALLINIIFGIYPHILLNVL